MAILAAGIYKKGINKLISKYNKSLSNGRGYIENDHVNVNLSLSFNKILTYLPSFFFTFTCKRVLFP